MPKSFRLCHTERLPRSYRYGRRYLLVRLARPPASSINHEGGQRWSGVPRVCLMLDGCGDDRSCSEREDASSCRTRDDVQDVGDLVIEGRLTGGGWRSILRHFQLRAGGADVHFDQHALRPSAAPTSRNPRLFIPPPLSNTFSLHPRCNPFEFDETALLVSSPMRLCLAN